MFERLKNGFSMDNKRMAMDTIEFSTKISSSRDTIFQKDILYVSKNRRMSFFV